MKRSKGVDWQLEGDVGSMGNIRASSCANGHKPVVPERLVAHEREGITKGAELLRRQEGLTFRTAFGKKKDILHFNRKI